MTAAIAAALFRAFDLSPPAVPPIPAGPERFPTIFQSEDASMEIATIPTVPTLPALPDGSPTLARHLHAVLSIVQRHAPLVAPLSTDELAAVEAARSVLSALPSAVPSCIFLEGKTYWRDEDGGLMPEGVIKPYRFLEDAYVRTVATAALATNGTLERLKALSFSEAQALIDTLAGVHGVKAGGKAGNVSFHSYDRAWKVQISVQERLAVNANIETAKSALNEWLKEADAGDEVRALVNAAFGLGDQDGVRVAELVRLKRLKIDHPMWKAAMAAIDDALDTAGKAQYLRVYRRDPAGKYVQIPLDLASV
ncbi:DUF3164 family protein [Azospirillum sp. 11R-A]|uniref:DUF3164 family protein n=1 Tax=Azospirillum sp. 11R-A TaxID=3111634 RepID=UPI003C19B8D7